MQLPVRTHCSLQRLNSLAVPSRADAMVELVDRQQLPALLQWLAQQGQPALVMGEGSNLVLGEQLAMPLILNRLKGKRLVSQQGNSVVLEVGAGENWHELVTWCVNRCYFGLENLALIPGTVGAAPVQNIGAYGVELSQFVRAVEFLDFATGEIRWLDSGECGFAYRDSCFKHELRDSGMILGVRLALSSCGQPRVDYPALRESLANPERATPREVYDAVVAVRQAKLPDPRLVPNLGSFFHNPVIADDRFRQLQAQHGQMPGWTSPGGVKVAAAWLIEQQGWKGREAHAVRVSPDHALVLTNPNRRPASDVLAMARDIQRSVRQAYDIALTIEPRLVGISCPA